MDNKLSSVQSLVTVFRKRARRLRLNSQVTLALVLVALGVGFYLFAFAERVVYFSGLRIRAASLIEEEKSSMSKGVKEKPADAEMQKLQKEINYLKEEMASLENDSKSLEFWIASLSTRVGAVLLLIFLVQILVTMYRYQVRLASYYDARADALDIAGKSNVNTLIQIIAALSPEGIEFGKVPKSPGENAVDLARNVLKLTERK